MAEAIPFVHRVLEVHTTSAHGAGIMCNCQSEPASHVGWSSFDPIDSGILERLFKKDSLGGEEKLMLAVLENAVDYFQKYVLAENERGKRLFQEAENWILEKGSAWLYSFENICEVLGLHPDYMRHGLMGWKEARLKRHAKRLNGCRTR